MSARRISTLLCASFALASNAAAQDAAPFVVQLRLPARGVSLDAFAWRTDRGIEVAPGSLSELGVVAPVDGEHVPLTSVAGLSYEEKADEGAIVISCTMACYQQQRIDLGRQVTTSQVDASTSGGYLNYEVEAQWIDRDGVGVSGIAEAAAFGRFGLVQSTWIGQRTQHETRITRLDTTWTVDRARDGLRARFGDSIHIGANGAPVRFGGIQIGRYFGLTPSMITYPTPAISGDAQSASTVELYVDGVLRAQSRVAAGPFVIDNAPIVSGAGETQLVITDVLGRQQIVSRPFFVSTTMLRPGLSDWSFAAGAERLQFGRKDADYGDTFIAGRYRYGVSNSITVEGAIEATEQQTTAQAGISVSSTTLGQASVSQAANDAGGYTSAAWYYDGRALSIGAQFEQRQGAFTALGRENDTFRQGLAGNAGLDMGNLGAVSLTAAEVRLDDEPRARTYTLSYTPDFADGALSFRLAQIEREDRELIAGVSLSFTLADDVSAHVSVDRDDRGVSYRASAQRAVDAEHLGWRARASLGSVERAEAAVMSRNALGDTMAEAAVVDDTGGLRLRHGGSVGWIDNTGFAGRRIDGAFALVDAGASDVSVARNQVDAGETGNNGRRLVTNLLPYDSNTISISPDDLPLDRAPQSPARTVVPSEGASVMIRFNDARERIIETRVVFANGEAPPRGSVLVRNRDGERFPIGSEGRIVLQGAQDGDELQLNNGACSAHANEADAEAGLTLQCAALS
ncbi:MAG: fimbria/pilus outer membrane usher protein [Alphaproteobacteria bacterium]|nr:fimbria/pilus outer membrane usher protein [Alphaproteobacteria bacterium]